MLIPKVERVDSTVAVYSSPFNQTPSQESMLVPPTNQRQIKFKSIEEKCRLIDKVRK